MMSVPGLSCMAVEGRAASGRVRDLCRCCLEGQRAALWRQGRAPRRRKQREERTHSVPAGGAARSFPWARGEMRFHERESLQAPSFRH